MRNVRIYVAVVALAFWCVPAFAFQETGVPGAGVPTIETAKTDPKLGIDMPEGAGPEAASNGAGKGTELRIPGLGRIGVLPKLDFGLELLYGADEGADEGKVELADPEFTDKPLDGGDITIRGTIKHKF